MDIYHNHHIIPRHMGGSDEPKNLIRLTVEQHAEAHKELYEKYGKIEDLIAYKALSKQITLSEASKLAHMIGSYRGGYAKKPNQVPAHNRKYYHCIGCRKEIKPSAKGHTRCVQKFYGNEPTKNHTLFTAKHGKAKAAINNAISTCPHCGKHGQYRAMKRWHYDNCKHI